MFRLVRTPIIRAGPPPALSRSPCGGKVGYLTQLTTALGRAASFGYLIRSPPEHACQQLRLAVDGVEQRPAGAFGIEGPDPRQASWPVKSIERVLARPVARPRAGGRAADRLDMAGHVAVEGIGASAGVAGADEADRAQAGGGHAHPFGTGRHARGRRGGRGRRRGRVPDRTLAEMQGRRAEQDCRDRQGGREKHPAWPRRGGHGISRFPCSVQAPGETPTPAFPYRPSDAPGRAKTHLMAEMCSPNRRWEVLSSAGLGVSRPKFLDGCACLRDKLAGPAMEPAPCPPPPHPPSPRPRA